MLLNIPRHHHHHHHHSHPHQQDGAGGGGGGRSGGSSNTASQQHSPLTPHAVVSLPSTTSLGNATCQLTITASNGHNNSHNNNVSSSSNSLASNTHLAVVVNNTSEESQMQELHAPDTYLSSSHHNLPRSSCASFQSEILMLNLINGDMNEVLERYSRR